MNREEYHVLIDKIISDPDTAAISAQTLVSEIDKDTEQIESLKAANTDYEKRIRDLQDTNIKLFLSQTGKKDEPEENEMSLKEFAHKIVSTQKGE